MFNNNYINIIYITMKRLFGKKKENPQDTIAKLRESLETLDKREQFLDKKIQQQLADAKRYNAAGNKRMAVAALKRKKLLTDQQTKIMGAREKIELQLNAIESAKMDMEIIDNLQLGTKTMNEMHKGMNVEKVDKVIDDMNDQIEVSNEIANAMSQPIGEVYDDDELLQELEDEELKDLEDENLDKIKDLPEVNRNKITEKDEEDLEALLM